MCSSTTSGTSGSLNMEMKREINLNYLVKNLLASNVQARNQLMNSFWIKCWRKLHEISNIYSTVFTWNIRSMRFILNCILSWALKLSTSADLFLFIFQATKKVLTISISYHWKIISSVVCDTKSKKSIKIIESWAINLQLTAFHLQLALLSVVRVNDKVHGTRKPQRELHHVENRFVFIEPHVMVGNCHRLKRHGFGVLEEAIRSPHILEPFNFQQTIFGRHVLGQSQSMILPCLCEKYVSSVGLQSGLSSDSK